jgi:hypothetical protein
LNFNWALIFPLKVLCIYFWTEKSILCHHGTKYRLCHRCGHFLAGHSKWGSVHLQFGKIALCENWKIQVRASWCLYSPLFPRRIKMDILQDLFWQSLTICFLVHSLFVSRHCPKILELYSYLKAKLHRYRYHELLLFKILI